MADSKLLLRMIKGIIMQAVYFYDIRFLSNKAINTELLTRLFNDDTVTGNMLHNAITEYAVHIEII